MKFSLSLILILILIFIETSFANEFWRSPNRSKNLNAEQSDSKEFVTESFCLYYDARKSCAYSGDDKNLKLSMDLCEIQIKASKCENFKNTLLKEAREKNPNISSADIAQIEKSIRTCDPKVECQIDSGVGACVYGFGKGLVFSVLGLVTTPWMLTELTVKAFESDKNCFENKHQEKEKMLEAFDQGILPGFEEFKIPDQIKKDIINQWPCSEIRNYLSTKQKKYYTALGPQIASGKIKNIIDEAPIAVAVRNIKNRIGDNWNCLNLKTKSEMVCTGLGFVAAGGVTSLLNKKYFATEIPPQSIGYRIQFSSSIKEARKLEEEFSKNPQMLIWKLEKEGRTAELQEAVRLAESSLKNEKIQSTSKIGEGITGAQLVTLSNGVKGVWKPAKSHSQESMKHELAAAEIDSTLGLNMVPITVSRELNGKKGSFQLFVSESDNFDYKAYPIEMSFLDVLIGNNDRHEKNYFTVNGKVIAIDHGFAFGKDMSLGFENQLYKQLYLVGKDGKPQPTSLNQIKSIMPSREVVQKLENTSESQWRGKLASTLTDTEISSFLYRRKKMLEAIREAEKKLGPEIYPDGEYSPILKSEKKK